MYELSVFITINYIFKLVLISSDQKTFNIVIVGMLFVAVLGQ